MGTDAHHLGHHPRHLGGRVELSFALARLGGEVAHQVLVGVAQQVIAGGAVGAEVERSEDGYQLGEAILHLLACPQLRLVVEIGLVDDALQLIRLGQLADDLVDLVADLLVTLQAHHIGETAALGDHDQRIGIPGVLVRHIFHKEQREDVVLVLRSVHAAAQFIAALPE